MSQAMSIVGMSGNWPRRNARIWPQPDAKHRWNEQTVQAFLRQMLAWQLHKITRSLLTMLHEMPNIARK